ncbi:MAG TPA: UvrD-helicase domain-containing protein [Anaerolineales bacterium]|nr:UvrD-helicase domain-containing protein [Anaerolineales bacterium]HMV95974.1 UvrD-helicase domain-containing protein [Anaerolineales bacterium]HMX19178.1 UvrD-helicase domain-containing protein [Anaerolineales bacterium]HMX74803.1 UvrD-helicase domain-containing protein [Anaerolineales bacterium]HMZ42968.1 UvrD-helicase domain-containing protein [Anaerolineales bacterium]
MEFLKKLNAQQKSAVTAADGPVLVVAGPGSGKTRVLTQRIAYLIASEGIRPWQILAVTFTNKAAKEMDQRVKAMLNEQATEGMMLGTFHSICARILRREADHLPLESNFVIYDSDDQERIVKAIIRELNLNEKLYRPASVHASISRAKNELIGAEDYPINTYRDEVVKRVYVEYQKRLISMNAVDFDDLLVYTARLLEDVPAVRDRYAQRFRHVLVDEFQDTNLAQYALVKHLASHHKNIFCVGDPDQSVYAWRGADYRNIKRFEQDFPDAQVVLLEQNYRSHQNILDAATSVIDRARNRHKKRLFSDRGPGEKIFFYEARDDYGEASFVVDTIAQLVASRQFEPGDCAVMYRTNAMSRLLEEAFLQARLPYKLVGAQRFYGRREVKDVIAFIRLIHNLADEASLDRIINVPPRGIGEKTLTTLHLTARQNNTSPGAILLDLARGSDSPFYKSFTGRAALPLADFGGMLATWRAMAATATPAELFEKIVKDINYKEYIVEDDSDESKDRWENVQELKRLALEYSTRTLDEFLENIALVADQDTITDMNAPTLLTLHAAKGLEFGAVFIVGLDDGIIPHSRSFDEPEQMEEERRLFYVGITRAKDKLYLLRAIQRGGRGMSEETYPSRFLEDLPAELLVGKTRTGKPTTSRGLYGRPDTSASDTRWALPTPPKPAPVQTSTYKAGTRVRHGLWGEGIVLDSKLQDGDEIVDVVFESVGIKRLAASLAKLTII